MRGYNGYGYNGVNAGMYNGGAVVFNSAPFAQYFLQQQAKKKAESDAQDKYYSDQMKAVTPTGMRAKDIEGGWSEKLRQWQELGIKNKKQLLNPSLDGYKTINEFNRIGNELKSDIERSKQAAEIESTIGKLKLEGKYNPSDDDREIQDDFSRSIYDPNRKGYTLNDLSVNRPPFDVNGFMTKLTTGRSRNKIVDTQNAVYDEKHGQAVFSTIEDYSPEVVKQIATNAPLVAAQDPAGRSAFQRMLKSDSLPALQDAYSKYFPGMVDTPEKAAAAYAIMNLPKPTISQETKNFTDKDADLRRAKELARYNSGLNQEEIKLKQKLENEAKTTPGAGDNIVTKHLDTLVNNAVKKGEKWEATIHGKPNSFYKLDVSPELAKSLTVEDAAGQKRSPNGIGVDKNGNFYGLYWKYKKDNDGNWVFDKTKSGNYKLESDLTMPISRTSFQASYANAILTPTATEKTGLNTGDRPPAATIQVPEISGGGISGGDWRTRSKKVD